MVRARICGLDGFWHAEHRSTTCASIVGVPGVAEPVDVFMFGVVEDRIDDHSMEQSSI